MRILILLLSRIHPSIFRLRERHSIRQTEELNSIECRLEVLTIECAQRHNNNLACGPRLDTEPVVDGTISTGDRIAVILVEKHWAGAIKAAIIGLLNHR